MFNLNVGPFGPHIYFSDTGNKQSSEVLNGLEKVDDYCDKLDISLVKINDLELVTEYNLGELPALVYYRHSIPILYEGKNIKSFQIDQLNYFHRRFNCRR